MDSQLIATLRLALVSGVGPRTRQALLSRFGDSATVLAASLSELREVDGVGAKLAESIRRASEEVDVESQLAICREQNVRIVTDADDDYPRLLREIHDPPAVLFVRGGLQPSDAMSIAIVGTRHATHYGLRQAERLASGLSRAGLTIVSG
ncbi:MAG: DNA-protecting protein DprA, partial [Planctomycetales bacterium]|nr:DNA-protecting protein DprA [Planctomycetales bacterium]MCA9225805.1 DNA-protecting protein DprA [Planctomycetales bacterium]